MCSIFGGTFGVIFGGILSDRVVKWLGIPSRLWILSAATVFLVILECEYGAMVFVCWYA